MKKITVVFESSERIEEVLKKAQEGASREYFLDILGELSE